MGIFLKPRITESEAARIFLTQLQDSTRKSWPGILELVRPTLPSRTAIIDNPRAAQEEFALCVVAAHLAGLERIFDAGRAERVRGFILASLGAPEALAAYRGCWERSGKEGEDPLLSAAVLLHERLGAAFSARSEREGDPDAVDVSPLAVILNRFGLSWWRYLGQKYRIEKPKAGRA